MFCDWEGWMSDGEDFKHWVKGVRRVSGAGGGVGGAWDCGDGDCWVAGCVGERGKGTCSCFALCFRMRLF